MPTLEILIGVALGVVAVALFVILRRERLRGASSDTHPFLVGLYRGCAVVLVAYVGLVVAGAVINALTLR